jgi:HEPN domain-containing protein
VKEITKQWIKKAKEDYIVTSRDVELDKPVCSAICFHSQQAVEKYIKAVLQENEIYFPKTHDSEKLMDLCKEYIPELEQLVDGLLWLTSYAVEVRYPGITARKKEAIKSYEIAKKVRDMVRRHLDVD